MKRLIVQFVQLAFYHQCHPAQSFIELQKALANDGALCRLRLKTMTTTGTRTVCYKWYH
jgi:hypothetical protein